MIYAENVYLLLAAPLLVSLLFLRTPGRRFTLFLIVGMSACLLAAYCNTFIAGLTDFDAIDSVVIVAPIVEEIFKFLPLAFQLLVFDPDNATQKGTAIALGIGYATFENACFLSQAGTSELFLVAIRGFAVGAMHIGSPR